MKGRLDVFGIILFVAGLLLVACDGGVGGGDGIFSPDVTPSSAKSITSFSFDTIPPSLFTIEEGESGNTISVIVPFGTDLTNLVPAIEYVGATITPSPDEAQDFSQIVTYTVTAEDGTSIVYEVIVTVAAPSSLKSITSFSFDTVPPSLGNIEEGESGNSISVIVPYGTERNGLIPTVEYTGATITPLPDVAQDFSQVVSYTVTAEDGTSIVYEVIVTVAAPSSLKSITSFSFDTVPPSLGNIEEGESGNTISVIVPHGTERNGLVPVIEYTGAMITPSPEEAQDFSQVVAYSVTAEDGTSIVYNVTVIVAPSSAKSITSFSFDTVPPSLGSVEEGESGNSISVQVPHGTDLTNLVPVIEYVGATITPLPEEGQDFSQVVAYTVTAEDGTSIVYDVTVTVAPSSAKSITDFSFGKKPDSTCIIEEGEFGNTILVHVSYGTDLTNLVPTIEYIGATIAPLPDEGQDFSQVVTYTITAEDGTFLDYSVTVIDKYEIGDIGPSGVGIVFYITDGGAHGYEVAPENQTMGIEWSNVIDDFVKGNSPLPVGIGEGSVNTRSIVKQKDHITSAAQICKDYRGDGLDDWFLPSKDELNELWLNLGLDGIGNFDDISYWSSSEDDFYSAWGHNFLTGVQEFESKSSLKGVRAIREF